MLITDALNVFRHQHLIRADLTPVVMARMDELNLRAELGDVSFKKASTLCLYVVGKP